jgi:hypothetical protein
VLEYCVCGASRPADAFDVVGRITDASQAVAGCTADAAQALERVSAILRGR